MLPCLSRNNASDQSLCDLAAVGLPQIVGCTAVSEHIPMLGPQFYSKLEGDPWWGHPRAGAVVAADAPSSAHAAGASDGVAADLTGALVEDEVAPAGEADLGAVAAGAGPVQVVERGRVGNVLVVDDEEVAGGVLAVGAAVDGPGIARPRTVVRPRRTIRSSVSP